MRTWGNTNPWADTPFAVPDSDASENGLQQSPKVVFPTDPTCGGSLAAACPYDGTARSNSGLPLSGPGDFFVHLAVGQFTGALTFVCLLHPGMSGSLTIVAGGGATTPPENAGATSVAQYATDTAEAGVAETAARNASTTTTNANGSKTVTVTAGTATPHVEVAEMLPATVNVTAGDTVKYTTTTISDIHTVTFPTGSGSNSVDPLLPPVCEGNPTTNPDTPASGGPPTFGCSGPADPTSGINVEFGIAPQPQGPTAIASASTVATSGIIGPAASPFPQSYSFSFPAVGTFAYQCRIHDHMTGSVLAAAVVVPPALPRAGHVASAVRPPAPAGPPAAILAILAILGLIFVSGSAARMLSRRASRSAS